MLQDSVWVRLFPNGGGRVGYRNVIRANVAAGSGGAQRCDLALLGVHLQGGGRSVVAATGYHLQMAETRGDDLHQLAVGNVASVCQLPIVADHIHLLLRHGEGSLSVPLFLIGSECGSVGTLAGDLDGILRFIRSVRVLYVVTGGILIHAPDLRVQNGVFGGGEPRRQVVCVVGGHAVESGALCGILVGHGGIPGALGGGPEIFVIYTHHEVIRYLVHHGQGNALAVVVGSAVLHSIFRCLCAVISCVNAHIPNQAQGAGEGSSRTLGVLIGHGEPVHAGSRHGALSPGNNDIFALDSLQCTYCLHLGFGSAGDQLFPCAIGNGEGRDDLADGVIGELIRPVQRSAWGTIIRNLISGTDARVVPVVALVPRVQEHGGGGCHGRGAHQRCNFLIAPIRWRRIGKDIQLRIVPCGIRPACGAQTEITSARHAIAL